MSAPIFKSKLRHFVKKTLTSKTLTPFTSNIRGVASVLCYHRLTELRYTGKGFYPNIYLCVRDDYFEQQIKHLSQNTTVCPLSNIVSDISVDQRQPHRVGISFDDGYRDNLELALPILEKYSVPATIFISTGLIDRSAPLWWEELGFIVTHSRELILEWDESKYHYLIENDVAKEQAYLALNHLFKRLSSLRQAKLLEILRPQCPVTFEQGNLLLTWSELQKLSEHPLITLGCHTVRHPILSNETESDVYSEIANSRDILSAKIQHPVEMLAYPVGGVGEAGQREFDIAAKTGLKAAFTTRTGHIFKEHQAYPHCLPRLTMDYFDTLDGFKWKLSGFAALIKNGGERFITD